MHFHEEIAMRAYESAMRRPAANTGENASLGDYLTENKILFFPAGTTRQRVFEDLIESLRLPDPSLALKEVLYRELWGRTVMAPGLSLPHARISGVTHISAALGNCPEGISDEKTPKGIPQVFVLFIGPKNNVQEHLSFLACASALFQKEGLADSLTRLTTPKQVLEKIGNAKNNL
jgi:PTS system nitrogen regulatory IIA component